MEALVGFPKREVQTISLIGFAHLLSHVYMLALAPLAPSLIKDLNITKQTLFIFFSLDFKNLFFNFATNISHEKVKKQRFTKNKY